MAEAKYKILVVDDEPAVLFTYDAILKRQGYDVRTAITSVAANEWLEKEPMDLVLTDYSLEQQRTGFEVIEFAREKQPGILAVLFTGYASEETARKAQEIGVPVLYKPLDLPELFDLLKSLLGKYDATNQESASKAGTGTR